MTTPRSVRPRRSICLAETRGSGARPAPLAAHLIGINKDSGRFGKVRDACRECPMRRYFLVLTSLTLLAACGKEEPDRAAGGAAAGAGTGAVIGLVGGPVGVA